MIRFNRILFWAVGFLVVTVVLGGTTALAGTDVVQTDQTAINNDATFATTVTSAANISAGQAAAIKKSMDRTAAWATTFPDHPNIRSENQTNTLAGTATFEESSFANTRHDYAARGWNDVIKDNDADASMQADEITKKINARSEVRYNVIKPTHGSASMTADQKQTNETILKNDAVKKTATENPLTRQDATAGGSEVTWNSGTAYLANTRC